MRKLLIDFDAVGWLKRVVKTLGALTVVSACLTAAAHAETRTLKLYNTHTKERVSITFKKNGRYLPEGLREANRFLRDWRRNEMIKMDPELLDLVWEVYQQAGGRDAIYVVSSYRSPATNNMLRGRSSGVAKNSQHTLGKAMDFYIPGVDLSRLRATGLRMQIGGVGYYPSSGSPFVHMDTGSVRHWPRMSRSQLAKVFPDGKTLHIPSDGKPLSGYKVALAEEKSGKRSSKPTIVASSRLNTRDQSLKNPGEPILASADSSDRSSGGGNLFANLFGGGKNRNEQAARPGAVGNKPPAPLTAEAPAVEASPVIENPPVPLRKTLESKPEAPPVVEDEPIAVASAAPLLKPESDAPKPQTNAPVAPMLASAAPAPNTLDSQRAALDAGEPAPTNQAIDERFQVARAPLQKPNRGLSDAAREAAANLGLSDTVPVPDVAPTDDPVAAIAAATGSAPAPAPRPETTLAYASAGPAPQSLSRSMLPSATLMQGKRDEDGRAAAPAATGNRSQASVSGRIPKDQIVDPLSGFASLPDKSAPVLLSGAGTTRHQAFASLSHPNQRMLKNVMMPANRFVAASFERDPYGGLRTDRFDGPAIVVLPVRYAR